MDYYEKRKGAFELFTWILRSFEEMGTGMKQQFIKDLKEDYNLLDTYECSKCGSTELDNDIVICCACHNEEIEELKNNKDKQ